MNTTHEQIARQLDWWRCMKLECLPFQIHNDAGWRMGFRRAAKALANTTGDRNEIALICAWLETMACFKVEATVMDIESSGWRMGFKLAAKTLREGSADFSISHPNTVEHFRNAA